MLFLYFLGLISLAASNENNLSVSTTSGILTGKQATILGKPMKLFLGVPYAQPPVGELRFKPPVPIHSENIEREAKSFAPSCYQPPHAAQVISSLLKPNQAEISEDCLYLNIYVPDTENLGSYPVIVFLAGEGFNYGDPQQFDGNYLSSQGKVIVITLNYRVSVFGFLSSLNEEAPGNVGLWDQRMALKWVKENIANFGGDPKKVTLFGRFTGAMSAAIHTFSPISKEDVLFQRIILLSGVPDGDWVFDRNPLNATLSLAAATDCLFSELSETLSCIKRIPADILLNAALPIPDAWRPVFDFNLIYEHTLKAAAKSNYHSVEVLLGINSDEGSLCISALKAMKSEYFNKIVAETLTIEDFEKLVENNILETLKTNDEFLKKLTVYKYKSEKVLLRDSFVKFCGDIYISAHALRLGDILSNSNQKVYVYELTHRPSFSNNPSFIKAGNGDNVLYSLGLPLQLEELPNEEKLLTIRFVEAVSNFASSGNPNSENSTVWPLYNQETRLLMKFNITPTAFDVQKSTYEDAVAFWHEIIPNARHHDCPLPSMVSALTADHSQRKSESQDNTYFLGRWVSASTAEFMLLALLCISGFLLIVASISIILVVRIKHHATFHRLK